MREEATAPKFEPPPAEPPPAEPAAGESAAEPTQVSAAGHPIMHDSGV